MREAVVVASWRTALAKAHRGSFNITRPDTLAAHCIAEVLRRTPQVDPAEVDDVILGCGQPHGTQGQNIGRLAAMLAGLPTSVAGLTVSRHCASGLQAIAQAAQHIVNDNVEVMIAGGVESITMLTRNYVPNPVLQERLPGLTMVMGVTAEILAKRFQIPRRAQDEYALLSQQRTARAQQEGFFEDEIAPMNVTRAVLDKKTGEKIGEEEVCCCKDECNRPDTTLEGLASLPPVFDKESGQGTVTAGNSSQLSDGASVALLMSRQRAEQLGIPFTAIFRGYQVAGCDPDIMGVGPVYAVPKLLQRTGIKKEDIALWELNEAFAVQVVYCLERLGLSTENVNVNGGSISIGHPFGMTGARMTGTLISELLRRKLRYGVVTMCVGGGQGAAALFEAVH